MSAEGDATGDYRGDFENYAEEVIRSAGLKSENETARQLAADAYAKASAREVERQRLLAMFEQARQPALFQLRDAVIFLLRDGR